jgi:hypothetical protein
MRVVRGAEELPAALEQAQRESQAAFGSSDVFLEKFIERPRHIEVQLRGDKHGNLVHLFERDCSVQRLVVAGGETAGAVVDGLGVKALRIGPPIDPGVPWTLSLGEPRLLLALKSGNFGAPDFFSKAFERAP